MTASPLASQSRRCCSDLTLDRLLNDDLAADEAVALRAHLDSAPLCRARHDALAADREAFRARLAGGMNAAPNARQPSSAATPTMSSPMGSPLNAGHAPTNTPPLPWVRRVAPALAGAAAIAAGLVIAITRPTGTVVDDVRAKGGAVSVDVDVWATTAGTTRRLPVAGTASAGDVLALHVTSAQAGFAAAIVGDDEAQVSLTPAAVDVAASADVALGEAVTLDVTGGDVRFAVVVCADREAVGPVLRGVNLRGEAVVETSGSCTLVRRVVPRAPGEPQP